MPRGVTINRKQLDTFLEEVAKGATINEAAKAAGAVPGVFYTRAQRDSLVFDEMFAARFADAIEERTRLKADLVDEKFEEWIEDPDRSDSLRLAWAKRHHPGFREKHQIEHTGPGGGPQEIVVKHDSDELLAMLEEVGLVRRFDAAAPDRSEPAAILPARTDS